jgi:phage shock protein C
MAERHLYRSRTNRMLGGVSGGLGDYLNIDPLVFRLLFVFLTIFGGSGILLYIIGWVMIPEEPYITKEEKATHTHKKAEDIGETFESRAKAMADDVKRAVEGNKDNPQHSRVVGVVLLVLGAIFLIQNLTGFNVWKNFWPLFIIIVGLGVIMRSTRKEQE